MKLLLSYKWFLVVETTYLIIIPLILCFMLPSLIVYRTWVMVGGLLYVVLMMNSVHLHACDIGLTRKNLRLANRQILSPAIFIAGTLVFLDIWGFN